MLTIWKEGEHRGGAEPPSPGREDGKGQEQLEEEGEPAFQLVPELGQRVKGVGEARGDGRCLVIEGHRAPILPVVEGRLPLG